MEIHEAADIFPLDEAHLAELADDLQRHGQLEAVKLYEGKVIDGRRRLRACVLAGVAPRFEHVSPPDPIAYVLSLNVHRRHLSQSERGMAAAKARALYDRQARERQKRKPADSVPANLPEQKGDSRDKAGKALGVSGKTVDHATKVLSQGVPELVRAVETGCMAVSAAAALSEQDEQTQRATVAARGDRKMARKGRRKRADEDPAPPLRGVGVRYANEAINCLIRIPKDDPQRPMARKIIGDWIKAYL